MAKIKRVEKLLSMDETEVEALRKVARSVRGEPDRITEAEVQTLRQNLDEIFLRIQNVSLPAVNPIRLIREALGMSQMEMAAVTTYSLPRWASIEAGGIKTPPLTFLRIVTDIFGPSAPAVFEGAWNRFRASLFDKVRRTAELKLFPFIGSGAMST